MQKEDLLKRIRLFATVVTCTIAVLVVGLIVQFGMIAYTNSEKMKIKADNITNQQILDDTEKNLEYLESDAYKDQQTADKSVEGK